jgi:hypothetical protein
LQLQLVVGDQRDRLPLCHLVAVVHPQIDDGAADARARRHHVLAFDGGEDGLFVGKRA